MAEHRASCVAIIGTAGLPWKRRLVLSKLVIEAARVNLTFTDLMVRDNACTALELWASILVINMACVPTCPVARGKREPSGNIPSCVLVPPVGAKGIDIKRRVELGLPLPPIEVIGYIVTGVQLRLWYRCNRLIAWRTFLGDLTIIAGQPNLLPTWPWRSVWCTT